MEKQVSKISKSKPTLRERILKTLRRNSLCHGFQLLDLKNRYNPLRWATDGIMGMNQRNVNYIGRYNKRKLYPLVDNKVLTKKIAISHNVKTPVLIGSVENQHQVQDILNILGEHTEFCIKPAHGSGGKGILVIKDKNEATGNYVKNSGRYHYMSLSAI